MVVLKNLLINMMAELLKLNSKKRPTYKISFNSYMLVLFQICLNEKL